MTLQPASSAGAALMKFARLKLGLKHVIDYAQSQRRMLGIQDLPVRTVLDIGANVGKTAKAFRRRFPEARIHCVEPLPECCRQIERWAKGQQGMVVVYNLALGAQETRASMFRDRSCSGGSTLLRPADGVEAARHEELSVAVTTLDALARQISLTDDLLVKIDVEGLDLEVIRGGPRTISRAEAVIVEVSLHESPHASPRLGEFIEVLGAQGLAYRGNLKCAWVQGVPRMIDAVFLRDPAQRAAAA